jgi:PAS domain S-box-containing protein
VLEKASVPRNSRDELLPESEGLTRAIVAAAFDAIVIMDHQGRILEFNPAAERLFGYRREDVLGRELADTLIPPFLRQRHRRELAHFLATGERPIVGKRVEVTRMRADGSKLLVELSVTLTGSRTPVFVGLMRDITEQKRTKEALRESEERFRTMANSAPVLIWMSGNDKLCTWFNEQWLTFVGRTMPQELGNGWAENVHPEDFDRCLRTYTTNFEAREPFTREYRLRRHDGQWRWVLDNGVPRYDPANNFAGYIGSCVDVTAFKLLEEERVIGERKLRERGRALLDTRGSLAESEATVRMLLDSSTQAILAVDEDGKIVLANTTTTSMFGYDVSGLLGQSIELLVPEPNQGRHAEHHKAFFAAVKSRPRGIGLDFQGRRKNGSLFPVEIGLSVVNTRTGKLRVAFVTDITERRRLDQSLRQRDQELAVLFDRSPDSLVRFDSNIRATHVNAAFENVTGISSKDIVGRTIRELPLPADTVKALESRVGSALTTGQPQTAYFPYGTLRGMRDFEVRFIPEFAADQSVAAVFSIARDITEQKKLQELAAAKERDINALTASLISSQEQERRRMARDIHDSLCQHLGALAAEIREVSTDLAASNPAKQRLQMARKQALGIADEARNVAHQLHPAILEDLGLPKALRSLCDEFRQQVGIRVKFRVLDQLRSIPIEAASCVYRIAQEAFNNVAGHARAKNVDVLLSARHDLHFSIRDDGVGFDPRTVHGARGLGLVSMQERARLANGKLSVDAEPGHGTYVKLVVHLPGSAS